MSATEPVIVEPTWPHPPRFWWLKRLASTGLLLAVGLLTLQYQWGRTSHHRLARAVNELAAAGWPVRAAELVPGPVPQAENAAAYFQRAVGSARFNDSPAATSFNFPDYPPFGSQWETLASKSVRMNAGIFPLARKARDFQSFDWGTRVTRPAIGTLLPHLNSTRQLANILGDAALYAHLHGDDAAALEMIRDIRHESTAVEAELFLVSHLVGVGIDSLAQARLQVIASGLTIAPDGDAGPGAAPLWATPDPARRPATRVQVRTLIAELLDERAAAEAIQRSWAGERAAQLDIAEWMGDAAPVLRPMFELDALRLFDLDRALVESAAQPTWPAAKAVLAAAVAAHPPPPPAPPIARIGGSPTAAVPRREPIDYTRIVSSNFVVPANGRATGQSYFVRAERRMSAVSLAAQLFRADQRRWPERLEALVPAYLPCVPRDPLAAGGRPLGYLLVKGALPDGGDRPIVYSVGRDGLDGTATGAAVPPKTPCYGWQQTPDEWRDLSRWSPPASATRPAIQPETQPSIGGGA